MYDVDNDDVDRLKKALPEGLQERGNADILPVKDDKGRWQAVDVGYFLPWTMWTELLSESAEGNVGKAMMTSGMLGGPVPELIAAIKTNKDPFTRREIVNEYDPPAKQIAAMMGYIYQLSMPTWLTNYGFAGHMMRALDNTVDKYGDEKTNELQAAFRLFGVNLYPIDPERGRAENLRRMAFEINQIKRRATQLARDRKLSPEERRDIVKEYGAMIKRREQEARKYASESRVHRNLR